MRRIAAHTIDTPDGPLAMAVVEIDGGRVVGWHTFQGEEPFTEWLGGTITLRRNADGALRAYKDGKLII